MSYSIDPVSANYYKGTTCLVNKLNIQNEETLSKVEADITFAKTSELEENPIDGNFDFNHYKKIHRYLFEDLYDWAGEIRTVIYQKKVPTL